MTGILQSIDMDWTEFSGVRLRWILPDWWDVGLGDLPGFDSLFINL